MQWKAVAPMPGSVFGEDAVPELVPHDSLGAAWFARLTPVVTSRQAIRMGRYEAEHVFDETVDRILCALSRPS